MEFKEDCKTFKNKNQIKYLLDKLDIDSDIENIEASLKLLNDAGKLYLFMSFCYRKPSGLSGLKFLESLAIGKQKRQHIIDKAVIKVHDHFFENLWGNMSKLEEENRFYNWYHGFTGVELPYWHNKWNLLKYDIHTIKTNGSIKTAFYGDKYDFDKIERQVSYDVSIKVPEPGRYPNFTLTMEIEKISMKVSEASKDNIKVDQGDYLNQDQIKFVHTITEANMNRYTYYTVISSNRNVNSRDIELNPYFGLKLMPGFNLKWSFNKMAIGPDDTYLSHLLTEGPLPLYDQNDNNDLFLHNKEFQRYVECKQTG